MKMLHAKCHRIIILFLKDQANKICSAVVYMLRTLPSLFRCGTFCLIRDILPHPILWRPRHRWTTLPTPSVEALGETSESGPGLALIPLVTGPFPSPQKAGLMGCAAPPFISPGPSHLSSDVGLFVLTVILSSFISVDISKQTQLCSKRLKLD